MCLSHLIVASALAFAVVSGMAASAVHAADPRIEVLISGAGGPYDETLSGFKQYLANKGVNADYTVRQLEGDGVKAGQAVRDLKTNAPRLIITLGSLATEAVLKEIPDTPVIAALILKADALKKAENATGVVLEIPIAAQLQWLKKVFPKARTVGVVFNPAENREKVESAIKLAQKQGLRVEAREVRTPADIPGALDRLARTVDVLWGVADSMVLTPQTAKLILLFSFRNKIPFIGPSSAWAKAGALYSLDWDYADMGAQCGEAAAKILQGTTPGSLPLGVPRKISFSLNRKTAEEMSLPLSDDVVREARTVF